MKRLLSVLAVLAALSILTTTSKHGFPVAHAQSGCSVATITGSYAVSAPGFASPGRSPNGNEVPLDAVGVMTFDGAGAVSTTYTLAENGVIVPGRTSSGSYTVSSDCTGSITFTAGDFTPNFNIVIIGGGTEFFGIETTPGFTGTMDGKKQ